MVILFQMSLQIWGIIWMGAWLIDLFSLHILKNKIK